MYVGVLKCMYVMDTQSHICALRYSIDTENREIAQHSMKQHIGTQARG